MGEMTLTDAQAVVRREKSGGRAFKCPCCSQLIKVYKRNLSGPLVRILVLMHAENKRAPGAWVHMPKMLQKHGIVSHDFSFLKLWGLIEAKPGKRGDGSRNTGFWRIALRGVDFLQGILRVPASCYVFGGKIDANWGREGFSENLISSVDALASGGFSYSELMDPLPAQESSVQG